MSNIVVLWFKNEQNLLLAKTFMREIWKDLSILFV